MENAQRNGAPTPAAKHRGDNAMSMYLSRDINLSGSGETFAALQGRIAINDPPTEALIRGMV